MSNPNASSQSQQRLLCILLRVDCLQAPNNPALGFTGIGWVNDNKVLKVLLKL